MRGEEVDRRTDVWAFGVVLWEMLTGKKLFQGDTVSDVLAATLTARAAMGVAYPTTLPTGVTRVLRHCLVQEPKERLHDIADARIDLQEAFDEPEVEMAVSRRSAAHMATSPAMGSGSVGSSPVAGFSGRCRSQSLCPSCALEISSTRR